jgi:DNA-directed RNA polymerase specialized sigma subunit
MEKKADHLRRVPMPGRWKREKQPNVLTPGSTDFGFGADEQRVTQTPKLGSLDDTYDFWQRNQSQANMDQLLRAAQPTINKALSSFAGGDKSLNARAKRLAIDAFRNYDPKKGAKLSTHLYIRLQPLQREYTQRSSILEIPERVQLDRFRLEQAETALADELGREPSDAELAEYIGLSTRRIAHVRKFARKRFSESQIRSPEGEPLQPASEEVSPEDIWFEFVHHDLDPTDKKILEWKTGMYDKKVLSTNEIARRLKITPSAVSQRAAKIALKLEEGISG